MQPAHMILGLAVGVQGWAIQQLLSNQVTARQRPWVVGLGVLSLLVVGVVGMSVPPDALAH